MIEILFALNLISSPYPFEVKQGITSEAVIGTSFLDVDDGNSTNAGVRFTYLNPDDRDAVITFELQALSQTVFTGANYKTPRYKFLGDISIAFYEFYNPFAFRLLAGPCAEYRTSKINGGISYRAGLGYYWKSQLSLFADIGGRSISRKENTSVPYDLSLSMQIVF